MRQQKVKIWVWKVITAVAVTVVGCGPSKEQIAACKAARSAAAKALITYAEAAEAEAKSNTPDPKRAAAAAEARRLAETLAKDITDPALRKENEDRLAKQDEVIKRRDDYVKALEEMSKIARTRAAAYGDSKHATNATNAAYLDATTRLDGAGDRLKKAYGDRALTSFPPPDLLSKGTAVTDKEAAALTACMKIKVGK